MKWKEWLTKLVRSTKKEKRSISEISYEEAQKILKQNKKSILLDVRSKQEYEERRLPGAILVPLDTLCKTIQEGKLGDKDNSIIAYCHSGARSKRAVEILKQYGYEKSYSLEGGINQLN